MEAGIMGIYKGFFFIICLLLCKISFAVHDVQTETYDIPFQQGLNIHLKEKKLAQTHGKVILLINPLSIPSLEAFDVKGYSLMNELAQQGFDVWGIDFIGQGKSSFPPEMQKDPAPTGLLPLQAHDAVPQLAAAIEFIRNKTKAQTIALLGWSWGSIVAAMYAAENPTAVDHLVLHGAMHAFPMTAALQKQFLQPYRASDQSFNKKLPAYQNVPWKMIESHWKRMTMGNDTIISQAALNAVGDAYQKIDPNPKVKHTLRRPMGPMKDLFLIWNNQPIYPIDRITSPTLVIYGDQDIFIDKALYSKLTHANIKKEVVLKEATHWVMYEKARTQFIHEILQFLDQ